MKLFLLLICSIFFIQLANGQFVAKVEVKDKDSVTGLCDKNEVYALFPMLKGQKEAVCPVSEEEIGKRLNAEVAYLKENSNHKDKGMVAVWINCKGEVIKVQMDNKTKDGTLDDQIVAVFNSLGKWEAGKLEGKAVDSMQLFSFEIKKGKISLN